MTLPLALPLRRVAALAALLVALVVVAWPSPAQAHARPISTNPADGQVLAEAPERIEITFSEPVDLAPEGTQLLDSDGEPIAAEVSTRDAVLTIEPSGPLADGTVVVTWRIVSVDSHPVAGGFSFSVGAPSATAVAVPVAAEDREVRLSRTIATGLQYVGTLGLTGLVGFVLLVATSAARSQPSVAQGWRRAATAFGALGVLGAVALVPLAALWEAGRPLTGLWGASTWREAADSPETVASVLVVAGSVAAWLGLRGGRDVVAGTGAATALAALAMVGHTRSHGPGWLVLGVDLLHLSAAACWWGGLVALAIALAARPRLRATVRVALVRRFSVLAGPLVAALVVAGIVLYWRIGGSLDGLWETSYGRALLVKSALMLPVVALAVWNRRLSAIEAGRDERRADRTLARTVRAEATILVGVVVATAVLVNLTPPQPEPAEAVALPGERHLELAVDADHEAAVVVAPARRGANGIRLTVLDADSPLELAGTPTLSFSLPDKDVGPLRRPMSRTASGVWEATVDLTLPGTWEVTVAVPLSEFDEPVVTGRVEVA